MIETTIHDADGKDQYLDGIEARYSVDYSKKRVAYVFKYADAKMVAAAPHMLAALVDCREKLAQLLYEGADHPLVRIADAAIARAGKMEGKSS